MIYEIQYSCMSHIGNIRAINQDNIICNGQFLEMNHSDSQSTLSGVICVSAKPLFGVFDGLGGEECGEIASYIAAKEASQIRICRNEIRTLSDFCNSANAKICQYGADNKIPSMGTTAALLLFSKKRISLCNVGDSKVFRLSKGKLSQISKDHITISSFGTKPPLSQNLGIPKDQMLIEPFYSQGEYQDGDVYLICSDGLTDMVSTAEIKEILESSSPEEATQTLIDTSLKYGGHDNTTVITLKIKQKVIKWHKKVMEDL